MNKLKQYIKKTIYDVLDEESTSGGVGNYLTPKAFSSKRQSKNQATKNMEKKGYKIIKKDVKEIKINPSFAKTDNGGKRYIPKEFEFPSFLLEPIKLGSEADEPRKYFKIASKGDEYILLIDPLVKTSFDEIERGRTSFSKEKKLFELTRFIKEKIPQQIRGIMKKYSQGIKTSAGSGFIPLPLILTKQDGKYYIKNPANKTDNIKADIGTSLYENLSTSTPENIEKTINLYSKAAKKYKEEGNESYYNKAIEIIYFLNEKYEKMTGKDYLKIKGISSIQEKLHKIIKEELLKEVTYSKFKNEVKFRTKNEQLHKAIREVKRKLQEIDRIVEYTQRMKQELSEGEEGVKYWKATEKNVATISEMINQLNNKIKNLHQ